MPIRVVVISDTHMKHDQLTMPAGDILVHCGDFTNGGTLAEMAQFSVWLGEQDYQHKIVIGGNHDKMLERDPRAARACLGDGFNGVVYLEDSGVSLMGLNFYGSPWAPAFGSGWAFQLTSQAHANDKWGRAVDYMASTGARGIDVLVTHGPPRGILDATEDDILVDGLRQKERVGCPELRRLVQTYPPQLHLFGHIHESPGIQVHGGTCFVNAANCDLGYKLQQQPLVVLL